MPFTNEVLAAALLAVYLLDSAHWLERGECAVEWRGTRPAGLGFGTKWTLAGRRPWLPRPFSASVVSRVRWRLPGEAGAAASPAEARTESADFESRAAAVAPIARLAAVNAALVALVAPALLVMGFEQAFVAAVAASALVTLVAATLAFVRRMRLGCSTLQVLGFAAIALVCLPCAGNFARALVGRAGGALTLPGWIQSRMDSGPRTPAIDAARAEIEVERAYADEGSPERARLDEALRHFPEAPT